jgi:hypothetical protein
MQANVKEVRTQRHRIYPVVQLAIRLAYVHVIEVIHKGFGISFNLLLPHTYRQGNRWSVPLSLICNYKLLKASTHELGASKRLLAI